VYKGKRVSQVFFETPFFRGQIQGSNTLFNTVDVELIHEGYKYKVQATKSGPNSYFLVMNGSWKEIEVHRMSDGGKILVILML
jgi:acetyl-CoA carboxylase/biotin carboxylase 1